MAGVCQDEQEGPRDSVRKGLNRKFSVMQVKDNISRVPLKKYYYSILNTVCACLIRFHSIHLKRSYKIDSNTGGPHLALIHLIRQAHTVFRIE